jgi:hypothetical protein
MVLLHVVRFTPSGAHLAASSDRSQRAARRRITARVASHAVPLALVLLFAAGGCFAAEFQRVEVASNTP